MSYQQKEDILKKNVSKIGVSPKLFTTNRRYVHRNKCIENIG